MQDPKSVERRTQVRELFEKISAMPVEAQVEILNETCGDDKELCTEIEALLLEAKSTDSPVEQLAQDMIWPALESLQADKSQLNILLEDDREEVSNIPDQLIGRKFSHFEILEPIGRGGMGMVYRAHDSKLDRTVALKFLPPSFSSDKAAKDRFVHEAKAASGLDHPNIATVYEVGETEDYQLFIAMGYYQGETLKEKIEKDPITPEVATDYAVQLADALDKVHANGVIHRDIKPGNLMITDEGVVKLLDFGLAKLSYSSGYTQVGQMVGTVAYMSPEQARGQEVDHRTDIWSLGIVLYEMLTGKRPFEGKDAQSAMHAILFEDPIALDEFIPGPLKQILGLSLAKDPERRYQSAEDLLGDLRRVQEGMAPKKRGGKATWDRRLRRRRVMAISSLTVLFVVIVLVQNYLTDDTFTPILEGALVEDTGNFMGGIWGDYDDDGFLDVVLSNNGAGKTNNLYHNNRDGSFTRVTGGVLATDPISPMGTYWVDVDNDGDLDIFSGVDYKSPNVFYRNDGDGEFNKVTEGNWLNKPNSTHAAAWGDYDNDGFLDLYVANSGEPDPEFNSLYHNMGDGTMEVVETFINGTKSYSHGCLWSDFDSDGDVDLFVSGQKQVQFRNDGNGSFSHVTPSEGGIPEFSDVVDIGFSSADYDNDGDLDVFYAVWKTGSSGLLYRNDRNRIFSEVIDAFPCEGQVRIVAGIWGDYDNDGYLDLFISTYTKNILYHNDGNGSFSRIMDGPVVDRGLVSSGCAWVDYDNDGDLDLFVANGMWNEFEQSCELYRNDGGTNNWIEVDLVGTVSNRSAIGAKVWARAKIDGQDNMQLREVQMGGNGQNGSGLRVHFGLGDVTTIDTLRIEWPSGYVQDIHDVEANQILTITEDVKVGPKLVADSGA